MKKLLIAIACVGTVVGCASMGDETLDEVGVIRNASSLYSYSNDSEASFPTALVGTLNAPLLTEDGYAIAGTGSDNARGCRALVGADGKVKLKQCNQDVVSVPSGALQHMDADDSFEITGTDDYNVNVI